MHPAKKRRIIVGCEFMDFSKKDEGLPKNESFKEDGKKEEPILENQNTTELVVEVDDLYVNTENSTSSAPWTMTEAGKNAAKIAEKYSNLERQHNKKNWFLA